MYEKKKKKKQAKSVWQKKEEYRYINNEMSNDDYSCTLVADQKMVTEIWG